MPELPDEAYHLADAANWPRIQQEGLLSAATLFKRSGAPDAERLARTHRPQGLTLPDGAFVRDQWPIPPAALARCLDKGLTEADWYALLNSCVFFWVDRARAERHAAAQGGRPTVLLSFDARRLTAQYADRACVTPINIGNARRRAAPRGWRTLVPLDRWRTDGWASEAAPGDRPRSASAPPAELVVRGDLPDAMSFLGRHTPMAIGAKG